MSRSITATVIVSAVFVAISTNAQAAPPTSSDDDPMASEGAADPSVRFTEDFETDPVRGWEFWCKYAFSALSDGRALATQGGGAAVWAKPGEVADFALRFRYGYEKGVADVSFHGSEAPGENEAYHLIIAPDRVMLIRRKHLPDGTYPERQLAAAPISLAPRTWHDVIIQAADKDIGVWIDDQAVLSFQDPNPLPRGPISLGAIANSGYVLYDDLTLIAKRRPHQGTLPAADVSDWGVWSEVKTPSPGTPDR
jgi:hypothetical protein